MSRCTQIELIHVSFWSKQYSCGGHARFPCCGNKLRLSLSYIYVFLRHLFTQRIFWSGLPGIMRSSLNIYTDFFGLRERPFSLVPDPDFLYWSAGHQRAFAMLEYGIMTSAPITLITGEVGAGKTTLLHHLLKSVGDDVQIGMIANAQGDRGELLRWVLLSLNQVASQDESHVDLFSRFQSYLINEYARGRRVVLIFDEAQNLSREGLEELRMFTNINSNKDELLQLVLVGQPELRATIRQHELRQFAQRVSAAFHLNTMDAQTVRAYIRHRLAVAGADQDIFSLPAADLVYDASRGVPRLVNQLCDLSMVYAYTKNTTKVSRITVQQVLNDGVFFGGATVAPAEPGKELSDKLEII